MPKSSEAFRIPSLVATFALTGLVIGGGHVAHAAAAPFDPFKLSPSQSQSLRPEVAGIRRPYQAVSIQDCKLTTPCAVVFPRFSKDLRVEVTHVSCLAGAQATATGALGVLFNSGTIGGSKAAQVLPFTQTVSTTADKVFAFNDQVLLYLQAGGQPIVQMASSGGYLTTVLCTLTGQVITVK